MAVFTGTAGADLFIGTSDSDEVYFSLENLFVNDAIYGGGTAGSGIDKLFLSGSGFFTSGDRSYYDAWGRLTSSPMYIGGFEQIYLSSEYLNFFLTAAFINSSSSGTLEIFGQDANDSIHLIDPEVVRTVKLIVYGGTGNDWIEPQSWNVAGPVNPIADEFYGGAGNDQLTSLNGATSFGGAGDDFLLPGTGGIAYGDEGNDSFWASSGSTNYGGEGHDRFQVGGGISYGGAGTDIFSLPYGSNASSAVIDGGDGWDFADFGVFKSGASLISIEGLAVDSIYCTIAELSQFSMMISTADSGIPFFSLNGGGSFNFSTFAGCPGSAAIYLASIGSTPLTYNIVGASVSNDFRGSVWNDTFTGGTGNDLIHGYDGNDNLFGGSGADNITDGSGNDYILGGGGDDTITISSFGEWDYDAVFGGEGNDKFYFQVGKFGAIDGGAGFDVLYLNGSSSLGNMSLTGVEALVGFLYAWSVSGSASAFSSFQQVYLSYWPGDGTTPTKHAIIYVTGGGVLDLNGKTANPELGYDFRSVTTENVTFIGGMHDDRLLGGAGSDIIYGGAGNDDLSSTNSRFMYGQLLSGLIEADDGADFLYGGDGNDTIGTYGYNDSAYGGSGDDLIHTSGGFIDGGSGFDTVSAFGELYATSVAGVEKLSISYKSNSLFAIAATYYAQFNEVVLTDNSFLNSLKLLLIGDGTVDVGKSYAGQGVYDKGAYVTCYGQVSGINLTTTNFNDTVYGWDKADTITAKAGNDQLYGGGGNDTIFGDSGYDYMFGESGADLLYGGADDDEIYGGEGDDVLDGGLSYNFLSADDGNDLLFSVGTSDLYGGTGNDWAYYMYASTAITANLSTQSGHTTIHPADGLAWTEILSGIENLWGSAYSDSLTGDAGANFLVGGDGNDTLKGLGGADSFYGGTGADIIDGGLGYDSVYYSDSNAGVAVNLTTNASYGGTAAGDSLTGVEGVWGSQFADTITGDSIANVLGGAAGNDYLDGGDGADYLLGGAGFDVADYSASAGGVYVNLAAGKGYWGTASGDTLAEIEGVRGSAFADSLFGDSNSNLFIGGGGNDYMWGADGFDVFWYDQLNFGTDTIAYFKDGFDKLAFTNAVASSLAQLSITGNGTTSVTVAIGTSSIHLIGAGAITLTAADFLFA